MKSEPVVTLPSPRSVNENVCIHCCDSDNAIPLNFATQLARRCSLVIGSKVFCLMQLMQDQIGSIMEVSGSISLELGVVVEWWKPLKVPTLVFVKSLVRRFVMVLRIVSICLANRPGLRW